MSGSLRLTNKPLLSSSLGRLYRLSVSNGRNNDLVRLEKSKNSIFHPEYPFDSLLTPSHFLLDINNNEATPAKRTAVSTRQQKTTPGFRRPSQRASHRRRYLYCIPPQQRIPIHHHYEQYHLFLDDETAARAPRLFFCGLQKQHRKQITQRPVLQQHSARH